jgi:predicted alpha/beta-fold hydrolase
VLLVHGLGGDSEGFGLRRLASTLQRHGFAVLRLNLRGAGEGRSLAPGTYSAACWKDLLPVFRFARQLAAAEGEGPSPLPLHGIGLSLGGTILLNACMACAAGMVPAGGQHRPLDRLACVSSPLDLAASAVRFDSPRNHLYRRWMLDRLTLQTLRDPSVSDAEVRMVLTRSRRPDTIRRFDEVITAPRWGFRSAEDYYQQASPRAKIRQGLLPLTLLLHSLDDPWVPAEPALEVADLGDPDLPVVLTREGGHNGFHGLGLRHREAPGAVRQRSPLNNGCWSDHLLSRWLQCAEDISGAPDSPAV